MLKALKGMKASALEFKGAYSLHTWSESARTEVQSLCSIRELINNAVEMEDTQARNKDLDLKVHVKSAVPKVAILRVNSLTKVVQSCLSQAISTSAPGSSLELCCHSTTDLIYWEHTLRIDIEWSKKTENSLENSSSSLLKRQNSSKMRISDFEDQKYLSESLGGSLSLKESGGLCTANFLLKISIPP